MDLDHKINDVLPLNAGGRGVLKAQALIFIILLAFTTCGRVMNVLEIPGKLAWVVCVAGDCHLHWVLVDHTAASGGASLTQQTRTSIDLGDWTEAFLHCVVLMELHVDLDWTISFTQTLGWCLVVIVTFSRVKLDWFVSVLAGLDVEQALTLVCALWTWSSGTTDWVDDLTG